MKIFRFLPVLSTALACAVCSTRAEHFTTAVTQGTGGKWTDPIWEPGGVVPTAGNTYQCVAGGPTRIRNPAGGSGDPVIGVKTFPGDWLQLDASSEIRAKGPGNILDFPGVGGNAGLILNGGNLDNGDNDAIYVLTGIVLVENPSSFSSGDTGANDSRGWRVDAQIRGSAGLTVTKVFNSGPPAVELTGVDNPFSGSWTVNGGILKATGSNSLGSGDIIINPGTAGAIFEVMYDLNSPGTLTLSAGNTIMTLHQDCRVGGLIIDDEVLANGFYSYAQLSSQYPTKFAAGGSGSIAIGPPTPSVTLLTPTNNAAFYTGNAITFSITSGTSMATNNIRLLLNGSNVSSGLVISGNDTNASVNYSGLATNTIYTGTLTVTNANGPSTYAFTFDTFVPGAVLAIETEDYNFGNGDCSDPNSPIDSATGGMFINNPAPGAYSNLVGAIDIDYHDSGTTRSSIATNAYRLCDYVGTQVATDVGRAVFTGAGQPDFQIWQVQTGDWLNYTRTNKAGTYVPYLRVASTGPASFRLDKVSGNTATTGQTTAPAGTFVVPNTSGRYTYVRLTDALGSNAVVNFAAGASTIRLTAVSAANNVAANYLVLVASAPAAVPPTLSTVSPAFNATEVPLNAVITATIAHGDTAVNPASIILRLNGTNVTAAAAITNSTATLTIYYDPPGSLVANTTNTVYLQFSDNGTPARTFTNTWSFRTTLGLPFVTKASQGTANHWGNAIWSNPPNTTVTSPIAGRHYEALYNGTQLVGNNVPSTRVRNPATGSGDSVIGVKTFPGDSLTLNAGTEIRPKGPGNILDFPGVGGAPGLILKGGLLGAGDGAIFPFTGKVLVASNSIIGPADNSLGNILADRGVRFDASLSGPGALILLQGGVTTPSLEITSSNNNTFSGGFMIKAGYLKGTGSNSLGTGNIVIDGTLTVPPGLIDPATVLSEGPALFEVDYDINTPATLTLGTNAQMILHQDVRFGGLMIEGTAVTAGTYAYDDLTLIYPNSFAAGGSGSITVGGTQVPSIALTNVTLAGTNFSFSFGTSSGVGYTVEYKDDLNQTNWVTLQAVAGNGGILSVTNSTRTAARRFFRVRSP